jgi:hypothetical protein
VYAVLKTNLFLVESVVAQVVSESDDTFEPFIVDLAEFCHLAWGVLSRLELYHVRNLVGPVVGEHFYKPAEDFFRQLYKCSVNAVKR